MERNGSLIAAQMRTYQEIADAAASKVGCGYIYGATGWTCSLARRQQQAAQYPEYAHMILGIGAKWDGRQCFDCAQLTKYAAAEVGVKLPSGATSQWRDGPWVDKGEIATMPDVPGVLLYRESSPGKMQHTGVYVGNGEAVEARGTQEGVIRSKLTAYGWTHWGMLLLPEQGEGSAVVIRYKGRVIGGRLNMRGQASATATILARIPDGALVDVLDVHAAEGWVFARYEGQTGYVMERYLVDVEDEGDGEAPADGTIAVSKDELLKLRGYAAEVVRVCDLWLGVG